MSYDPAPLSKTAKYKKITKPLLERKRRARINRCLDELKDLMVGALEIDDDNLSKLEKADILELTVNHITKLHSPKDPALEAKKFQAGFGQCAAEACRFIMSVPDLDARVSKNLISHLSSLVTSQPLTIQVPDRPSFSPSISPTSTTSDRQHYYSDHERSSSDAEEYLEGQKNYVIPARRPDLPAAGLLTTVDRLPPHDDTYRRSPGEAKETILQKIRQHIMDKRGNDSNIQDNSHVYRENFNEFYTSNDTLDLRKVRSPAKSHAEQPKVPVADKIERPNLPERCELQMDYNNLPPKKKRKLLEYQEYKKQEEARRRDAFCQQKNVYRADGPPAADGDASAWRPW